MIKTSRLYKLIHDNKGLTLIELAIASLISSIIIVGLAITLLAGTGAYHDDWVKNDLRNYGYHSIQQIKEYVISADKVTVDNWNGYDRLSINRKGHGIINIVALENKGFFIDDQPMDPHVKFPNSGEYREGDQRKITIDKFICRSLDDIDDHDYGARQFSKFRRSLWTIELKLKLATKYSNGEEGYEYLNIADRFFIADAYLD